jgi:tRNA threonylcarbamoyladenosine biosynthesis protein TsaE
MGAQSVSAELERAWESFSVEETMDVARQIAALLSPGDCVAIFGELGAGKTQLVRGIVEALGGDGRQVSSPTFTLVHAYETPKMPVIHIDAYRIRGTDEVEGIGFAELLNQHGVTLIEWAQRVEGALPAKRFEVRLVATDESTRWITLRKSL